ncbi:MAG: bifunctional phosphopantothenoylcysteine decarboxylase/phosphopantothenate--cysteine ligase CoaBC, partial [Actinobacteria bacterium]|nr:bifunctional phosphopantothenoylcysteine decarboxylase/phosphopantothenate--cysteine ligase CoaBC [Actinomycetota bacterium]
MSKTAALDVGGRKIVLAVSGGIAAYKVVHVARSLTQAGADVRVVMTRSAERFIGDQTFAGVTGNPVARELFGSGPDAPHVELARGAAAAVVAPATANTLAKMAAGLADDLLSATLLSVQCPIVVAPAMHAEMWANRATSTNLEVLVERGVLQVGPHAGPLMSGDVGMGRMAEPEEIVTAVLGALGRAQDLAGRRVVVTAGGTQEPIDPVRFIGNRSSGLMGFAIAREAARRGGKVTLVSGPNNLTQPPGIEVIDVHTADEMRAAVLGITSDADVIVKAAAVADFKPVAHADKKLKKAEGPPEVVLEPTPDILAELGANPALRKAGSVLVGFAAETEESVERLKELARGKLESKGADMIVANEVGTH